MWAAVAIVGLLAAGLFLLWVPLDLTLSLEVAREARLRLRLAWFFGRLAREIGAGQRRPTQPKQKPHARPTAPRRRDIGTLFEILRVKGILRQVLRLLRDLFRQVKFRHLQVNLRIGLGDPADTGLLFAVIGSATPFLGPALSRQISLQPVFADGAVCQGYLQGALRLRPVSLLPPLGRFIFSPPLFRLGRVLIRRAWRRRK